MEMRRVGRSGLKVSEVVLGCMSFGDPTSGSHAWTLPWERARELFVHAFDLGITTLDTADVYSGGTSEVFTGRAAREFGARDDLVIATKVHGQMRESTYSGGLSRKHILEAVNGSLRRLGTDFIDLYQIHRFDPSTPVEETMQALDDVVRAGKVRYLGASSMAAWQFSKMQYTARLGGWTEFVSMQDQYNLLQREEEREMHPLCIDQGVGVLPWSPLARGKLARTWTEHTERSETDLVSQELYGQDPLADRAIVDTVHEIALDRHVSAAQVALAWVRQHDAVAAPIVGATRRQHLDDAVASLRLTLSDDELSKLNAIYTPRRPEGF